MAKASLIFKVLSGEASKDEQAELEQWIAQSEANKSEYEHLKLLWDNTSAESQDEDEHFYDGFARIKSKFRQRRAIRRRKRLITWTSVIVATVLVTIALFITTDPASNVLVRFDDAPLAEVITVLETEFHIDIETDSGEILACRFTGTFYKKDNEQALIRSLSNALNLQYEIMNHHAYRLRVSGCTPAKAK